MTVKTKLKGRGTFSGNMSGSMQDSVGMSHGLGLGTASNRAQAYPQTYDPRISAQHEALGMLPASGGMPNFQQGW